MSVAKESVGNLTYYDAARAALEKAHNTDEVKSIRNKAEAMRVYAKQAQDKELELWAAKIRIRAERRAGQLLKEMDRVKPTDRLKKGPVVTKQDHGKPSLSDLGITKNQSSKWQRIAAIPEEDFVAELSKMGTASIYVSTKGREPHKPTFDYDFDYVDVTARIAALWHRCGADDRKRLVSNLRAFVGKMDTWVNYPN